MNIDLGGTWTIVSADGRHRAPMAIPGDVHSALIAAGVIRDPHVGRNEYEVRWVAETEWTARRIGLQPANPPDLVHVETSLIVRDLYSSSAAKRD